MIKASELIAKPAERLTAPSGARAVREEGEGAPRGKRKSGPKTPPLHERPCPKGCGRYRHVWPNGRICSYCIPCQREANNASYTAERRQARARALAQSRASTTPRRADGAIGNRCSHGRFWSDRCVQCEIVWQRAVIENAQAALRAAELALQRLEAEAVTE